MYIRISEGLGQFPTSYLSDSFINQVGECGLGQVTPPSGSITVAKLASNLTNLVFWERNPALRDQRLTRGSREAAEWRQILNGEVKPTLHNSSLEDEHNSSTQQRIGKLIFFSRHPNVRGHFKDQPRARQQQLSQEFIDIINNIVRPFLALQIKRGNVNSRTIFVVDNDALKSLPWETRTRAGDEIASQFAFINGGEPMTVIFLDPVRFPEEFNFSDAVVSVTDLPPSVHVLQALQQQVNNLNRAMATLGSRQRFPAPDRKTLNPDRYGLASMNKLVALSANGTQVAAPLMSSAVNLEDLISHINEEYIPEVHHKGQSRKDEIPKDRTKWSDLHKEIVGIALGRAMAHEVRHLFVRNPVHAADGLGSDGARLFGRDLITFSATDRRNILSSITTLERQQGTRSVAASFAAAERSLDFPF